MKTIATAAATELQKMASAGAFAWLIEFRPNAVQTIYLCSETARPLTLGSTVYRPFPLVVTAAAEDDENDLAEVTLRVSNATREFSTLLLTNDGFERATARVRGVLVDKLPSTDAVIIDYINLTVQGAQFNDFEAVLTLGNQDLFGVTVPARAATDYTCGWSFRGQECGYAGAETECDKSFNGAKGCVQKSNTANFGGFAGFP